MTSADIELAARNRYNAIGDTNWSTLEFLGLIDNAQMELAREALCIERTYTTTTVIGTQEYDFPTNTIAIKRVTYDGKPMEPITFQEDDSFTVGNSATTATGVSIWYTEWEDTLALRPIPSEAVTLKIYSYNEPQPLVGMAALETPSLFHGHIVNFVVAEMYAKDENFASAQYYRNLWEDGKKKAIKWFQRKKRTNKFATVKDEDTLIIRPVGYR